VLFVTLLLPSIVSPPHGRMTVTGNCTYLRNPTNVTMSVCSCLCEMQLLL
jgi:hypothetical protein